MFAQRREKLKKVLAESGAAAFFATSHANCYYFSGYTGEEAFCLFGLKGDILLTDGRYLEQAHRECPDMEIVCWQRTKGQTWPEKLAAFCRKTGISNIAFEQRVLTYEFYTRIMQQDPAFGLIPGDEMAAGLRIIKDETEIACHKRAAEISDTAFAELLPTLAPGQTEKMIAAKLEYLLKTNGADGLAFPSIVASGKNSSLPHAIPGDKKTANGDFITFDFGARYRGYCADMTRTIVLGKASAEQKKVYETVLKAQTSALEQVRPGVCQGKLHQLADDIIAKAGYAGRFTHSLGHGVGLDIHEQPYLYSGEPNCLAPGMVVTIEPGIYIPGWGGVRIEDMVLVTEIGQRVFGKTSKKLMVID